MAHPPRTCCWSWPRGLQVALQPLCGEHGTSDASIIRQGLIGIAYRRYHSACTSSRCPSCLEQDESIVFFLEGLGVVLKTAVAIRHVHYEDLGYFEEVLAAAGYKVHYYDAGIDELWTLDPIRTSLVVILGGPMGVYEADQYPFINEEIHLIQARIEAGRPLLGICLGAQLIAHALGAQVYPGPVQEIGLGTVELSDAGRLSPLKAIRPGDQLLHWHGDTFDLPTGAILLASTTAYANQAFSIGRNVLALQFHLEAGENIGEWLADSAATLRREGIDADNLQRRVTAEAPALKRAATEVLTSWLTQLTA